MRTGVRVSEGGWWQRPWMIFWVGFGLRVVVILVGHTYRMRTERRTLILGLRRGGLRGRW